MSRAAAHARNTAATFDRTALAAAALALGFAAACGGSAGGPVASLPLLAATDIASGAALPPADVELRTAQGAGALVHGAVVPFDGVAEGLAWPALERATQGGAAGSPRSITIAVERGVPVRVVLRAVWSLRDADIHLRTADAGGVDRTLDLRPKTHGAASTGCHLAVFVAANGDLRVAAPGGPRTIAGPGAADTLARALEDERSRCTLRYVAFGAEVDSPEGPAMPWGSVFDVARAVDRNKSAGDARYVLGEPVHAGAH
jgi:hypothetical protein